MEKLQAMADALMKYETIDRLQIDDIMEGKAPRPPANWEDNSPSGPGQNGKNVKGGKLDGAGSLGEPAELH